MAFIYILHFDEPLAHARHYTGCTEALQNRLTAHAIGRGSRLTRHLHEQGLRWKLGGLYSCSHKRMRELERGIKDQANAARYCQLCCGDKPTLRFTGTKPYDVGLVPFPANSQALQLQTPTLTCMPTDENMVEVIALMKRDKDALGFIPAGGKQGLEVIRPRGQVIVAIVSHQVVGYLTFTTRENTRLNIQQCCVADGSRFCGIGTQLVLKAAIDRQAEELACTVRDDLAANHFWEAIGFQLVSQSYHETSGKRLNHYQRKVQACQLTKSTTSEPTASPETESEKNSPISPPPS